MGRLSDIPDHDSFFDPPDYCKVPDCDCIEYKDGLCSEHYEEKENDRADYLYDSRRDRKFEERDD